MPKTGRPRSARAASAQVIRIKLRLYPGEDDDLISFFAGISQGLRAATVKRRLRDGNSATDATETGDEDSVLSMLDELVF